MVEMLFRDRLIVVALVAALGDRNFPSSVSWLMASSLESSEMSGLGFAIVPVKAS